MEKSADAYRTISEVAEELKLPQHVLRFWETRFPQIKPMKRGGNRRFYRPDDVELLRAIKALLYGDGFTIKGVQRILKEQGPRAIATLAQSGQLRPSAKRQAASKEEQEQQHQGAAAGLEPSRRAREVLPAPMLQLEGTSSRPDRETAAFPVGGKAAVSGPLPDSVLDRLDEVLFELSECERILANARA